jgi:peptidoglycan/xylan/chitin deacetylase (PgdA/CDA1 family)
VAFGTVVTGASTVARRRRQGCLRILLYHGVVSQREGPAAYGDLFMTASAFARQMSHLKRCFRVLSLAEARDRLSERHPFPDRAVVVTFDDGYRNTLTVALPILQALRLPVTVFVATGLVGTGELLWFDALRVLVARCAGTRRALELGCGIVLDGGTRRNPEAAFARHVATISELTAVEAAKLRQRLTAMGREEGWVGCHPELALAEWDEWRRAAAGGLISVGSHGCTHGNLVRMNAAEQVEELRRSKQTVERELGQACWTIAYPYGAWDHHVTEAARAVGYLCGVTVDGGDNSSGADPLALRRTMVGDRGNFYLFAARASGLWERMRRW